MMNQSAPPRLLQRVATYSATILDRKSLCGEPELLLVPLFCSPSTNSIDIGAFTGLYTFHMARLSHQCFAFEPNPDAFYALKASVPDNVVLRRQAVSDELAIKKLYVPQACGNNQYPWASVEETPIIRTSNCNSLDINSLRLDDEDFGCVSFIKVDVEGHELQVIQGAANLIRKHQPAILLELEERHQPGCVAHTQSFLSRLGYHGYFLAEGAAGCYQSANDLAGALRRIERFDLTEHQKNENAMQMGGTRPKGVYVKNFIFVPHRFDLPSAVYRLGVPKTAER